MPRSIISLVLLLLISQSGFNQSRQASASEIRLKLKKLNFLGSVLYVAAHPDDENTRAIAYLANERLAATAYLSMTRGDGGQNLIGSEIRDLLGVIRTQELMAARKIDGGEQFFTRANDFGFSKNSKETFSIWAKDTILSDVVRIYRQFQPDIIITRFPPDERAGHGHHTGSAILAQEAFDLSGKQDFLPKQVSQFGVWQPIRLFTNTGRWWNQSINSSTPGIITVDMGTYNSLLGVSYSEMAAISRTQHKSQGFGSAGRRGESQEFFEFVKGASASNDLFEGINTSWSRIRGGEQVKSMVDEAIARFNSESPAASIPQLVKIYRQINQLNDGIWKERKKKEVIQLIQDCAGLYIEASAGYFYAVPGEKLTANIEIINRSAASISLKSIHSKEVSFDSVFNLPLGNNQLKTFTLNKNLKGDLAYSGPYWLKDSHEQGYFTVKDQSLIGAPQNRPAVQFEFVVTVEGESFQISAPLQYKWTDPVKGELFRPLEITPPFFVNMATPVLVFKDQQAKQVEVVIAASSGQSISPRVRLKLPSGWKSNPEFMDITLSKRGVAKSVMFEVVPSKTDFTGIIEARGEWQGVSYSTAVKLIQYDHIPVQTLLQPAQAKVIRAGIETAGSVIGYVQGAGDDIPGALRNLGYEVWEMKNEEITQENLKKVDAVILGIRTINTNESIRNTMPTLLEYVKSGGTVISQYNTNFDFEIDADKFSPYPITLGRDRVTNESSEVRILSPDHPVMNYPNKIRSTDFDGWVQERGLYFPSSWDTNYQAILSMNDNEEKPKDGSLLVARYGEGYYVYTSLSFFRQLPDGVPGAYKFFANLVSLKGSSNPENQQLKTKSK